MNADKAFGFHLRLSAFISGQFDFYALSTPCLALAWQELMASGPGGSGCFGLDSRLG
jgi:hypothetical protein